MRVLWVTNLATTGAARLRGGVASPFAGWVEGGLAALNGAALEVGVASPGGTTAEALGSDGGVDYFAFPPVSRREAHGTGFKDAQTILDLSKPDLVHLHGTELPHSLSFARAAAARGLPFVVSIQGLVSFIATYMEAGLPKSVIHGPSTRPWVRSERVAGLRRSFEAQAQLEHQTLRLAAHAIGRTNWDRSCSSLINPDLTYHYCGESMRSSFYRARWNPANTRDHAIFVAQGHYPVKGLHILMRALPLVRERFPDVTVTVAGASPVAQGWKTPYSRHLGKLIKRSKLESQVRFVGPQTEEEMLRRYLGAHVVACPSLIENSPNSVAEAMLLGAPLVAANVGGVPDLIRDGVDGLLYQSEAPEELAAAVCAIFESSSLAARLGTAAREQAIVRHDPVRNARRMIEIYSSIAIQEFGHE